MISALLQDLRYGLRVLRNSPGFTIVAVLTLALGIGSSSTVFSVVDAVMLRPFAYPESDRLVVAWETNLDRDINKFSASIPNYLSWLEQQASFEELAAWERRAENRTDGERPEQVRVGVAMSALFRALKIQPARGRFFSAEEDDPRNRHVAVLGNEYWQRSFNGDPGVVGVSVTLNGEPMTIVGIAPPMQPDLRADLWRPLAPVSEQNDRGDHHVEVLGRLKPGVTIRQAEAALRTIAGRLQQEYPKTNEGWSVRLEPLFDAMVGEGARRALLVLLGSVGLLLLIGCANVANLLLARGTGRSREMAVRRALGAGRRRIAAQLLTESVMLALVGGACGVLLAVWGLDALRFLNPGNLSGLAEARIDGRVLAFSVFVSVATGVLFGLAPALHSSGDRLPANLREVGLSSRGSLGRQRLRQILVVGEVALALVLLVGAGLLLRSFERLRSVPLGFEPERVLTAKVTLYESRYPTLASYQRFFDQVLERTRNTPGVRTAGIVSTAPFGEYYTSMAVKLESQREQPGTQTQWRVVGGDYFGAMGIPLLRGRLFDARDDATSASRKVVISRNLAERLWPGEDPLGRYMLVSDSMRPYEVIGVVGEVRDISLASGEPLTMYFHFRQFRWLTMTLALRTTGEPEAMTAALQSVVSEVDPEQPLFSVQSVGTLLAKAAAQPRMNTGLLAFFAFMALLLASVGVYGVVSYAVEQRTNEIGVRLALGAKAGDVLRLVIGQGLLWAGAGVIVGLLGAFAVTRALESLLFEISPTDPVTFGAVALLLTAVAALACYLPARRAAEVDPMTALRHE